MFKYKKLWHLLLDKGLKKSDLQKGADISWSAISKLSKDEFVGTDIVFRICNFLKCSPNDIWEMEEDTPTVAGEESLFDSKEFASTQDAIFPATDSKFSFIDLFAGIGGFRIAAQNLGGECVFSSEFDLNAQKTYAHNFGEIPYGDITLPETKKAIPDKFDCLFGGFPCQPFSIAGYRKGFSDTRGTLFYDIAEILQSRKPKAVFLENVKNLKTHDGGKTFEVIKATLEDLGYFVYDKVMNAMDYANVPQNRERIFIVCFDPEQVPNYKKFKFPEKQLLTKSVGTCIDDSIDNPKLMYTCAMSHYDELVRDITDESSIYQWRRQYVRKNQSHVCPTLTANMGTGGHNVPLIIRNGKIRKLSPKECLNFQGFPDKYQFPATIPMSAMYKQAGNSVVVPLIQAVCAEMVKVMEISSGGTNE